MIKAQNSSLINMGGAKIMSNCEVEVNGKLDEIISEYTSITAHMVCVLAEGRDDLETYQDLIKAMTFYFSQGVEAGLDRLDQEEEEDD